MSIAALAARAVALKQARLLAAAAIELPGVTASVTSGGIALTAPGLRDRAFGTRTVPRDLRLIAFVENQR